VHNTFVATAKTKQEIKRKLKILLPFLNGATLVYAQQKQIDVIL